MRRGDKPRQQWWSPHRFPWPGRRHQHCHIHQHRCGTWCRGACICPQRNRTMPAAWFSKTAVNFPRRLPTASFTTPCAGLYRMVLMLKCHTANRSMGPLLYIAGTSAGVGFSIPISAVSRAVPQLIQYGRIIRPALNLQVSLVPNALTPKSLSLQTHPSQSAGRSDGATPHVFRQSLPTGTQCFSVTASFPVLVWAAAQASIWLLLQLDLPSRPRESALALHRNASGSTAGANDCFLLVCFEPDSAVFRWRQTQWRGG